MHRKTTSEEWRKMGAAFRDLQKLPGADAVEAIKTSHGWEFKGPPELVEKLRALCSKAGTMMLNDKLADSEKN